MQTLLLILTGLIIFVQFGQNYVQLANDAEASPTELSFNEWLKHTWLEIILNLGCFAALCFGIDIGLGEHLATVAASGDPTNLFMITVATAVATAAGIRKIVQLTLLPMFSFLFKARTARKVLRDKVSEVKK